MEQGNVGNAGWTALGDQIAGVIAWIGASESASAGLALAGSLAACLVLAWIISARHRSRL